MYPKHFPAYVAKIFTEITGIELPPKDKKYEHNKPFKVPGAWELDTIVGVQTYFHKDLKWGLEYRIPALGSFDDFSQSWIRNKIEIRGFIEIGECAQLRVITNDFNSVTNYKGTDVVCNGQSLRAPYMWRKPIEEMIPELFKLYARAHEPPWYARKQI